MEKIISQINVLPVKQPIGEFYVGVVPFRLLLEISSADMRRIESELDRYIGVQRKLSASRVQEIGEFVNTIDAAFPTSIVLAVRGECARFNDDRTVLYLVEGSDEETGEPIPFDEIARILDGQHRIEGLRRFSGENFDLPVSLFVNADIADQAYIFGTVNLAQTKVNRSLVYDLLDYSKARSPQKSCHHIAVALDKHEKSPFRSMIKRLGTATPGRQGETLTQATFVSALLPLLSDRPLDDRDALARGKSVKFEVSSYRRVPLRGLWVSERDTDIARILMRYFAAVAAKWPDAWASRERGDILVRTNGFRAFMRFFKNVYVSIRPEWNQADAVPTQEEFAAILSKVGLVDSQFNTEEFPPGTSGEKRLYDRLRADTGI